MGGALCMTLGLLAATQTFSIYFMAMTLGAFMGELLYTVLTHSLCGNAPIPNNMIVSSLFRNLRNV